MRTITLVLPEEQADRLEQSARCRDKSLAGLLKARLIDLLEGPADPFDPRGQRLRDADQEFLRRIL